MRCPGLVLLVGMRFTDGYGGEQIAAAWWANAQAEFDLADQAAYDGIERLRLG